MKLRSILLIVVSLVFGVFAIALINNRGQSAPPPSVQVVAAKVRLNFGDHVKPESLRVMNFPADTVLEGAFAKIEEIAGPGEDRVVLRPMAPGEPVLASKISGTGGKATLSTVVEKGMRAMTIRVNDVTGGGGFVLPQDRVDVLLTRNGTDAKQTIVLLQNIKVLGIDQQADEQKDKPIVAKAVTLEVTPDEAQKLTLGSSVGSLSLLLRNYANPDVAAPNSVLSIDDLFAPKPTPVVAGKPEMALKAAAAPPRRIEIMRGTNPTSYDVNKDGSVGVDPENSNAKMTAPKAATPKPAKLGARQQTAEQVSD
jgi:pilus assembly protein CpaB